MSDYSSQMSAVIGSAPPDLRAYYERGIIPNYPESRIQCLTFDQAKEYSTALQRIPVIERLGLWALDDANDSNPFTYISKGPCAGMILHLSHDDEPEIAFRSLNRFLEELLEAGKRRIDIDEVEKESIDIPLDQAIRELALEETDDATFLLTIYLPVSSALQPASKDVLMDHSDFFVREAFAAHLAKIASATDESIAEQLANDRHPQVAHQGLTALTAIRRKKYPNS